eukprot:s1516_g7.t1
MKQNVVVYSDASFEANELTLGWVIFHPVLPTIGGSCRVPRETLASWAPRKQQIFPGETLCGLVVPVLHPDYLQHQDITWYVDNEAATSSLVRGSSKQIDVHMIAQFSQVLLYKLGARTWWEWIDSASNPSDGLSRLGETGGGRLPFFAHWSLNQKASQARQIAGDVLSDVVLLNTGQICVSIEYRASFACRCCPPAAWREHTSACGTFVQGGLEADASKDSQELEANQQAFGIPLALAKACRDAAQWIEALQICVDLQAQAARAQGEKGLSEMPNAVSLLLLAAFERGSQWRWALLFAEGSEKAACTAMSACVHGSQWSRALLLLQKVREGPMAPDAVTLTAAMSACRRGRHWRGALHILEEIRRGSCADAVALNTALGALASAQRWQLAAQLFATEKVPQQGAFHALLSAMETSALWWRALSLFHEVSTKAPSSPSLVALNSVCSACEKASEWEMALALLRGPEHDAISCSAVSLACSQASRWSHALCLSAPDDLPSRSKLVRKAADSGVLTCEHQCSEIFVPLQQQLLITAKLAILSSSTGAVADEERLLSISLLQLEPPWWLRRGIAINAMDAIDARGSAEQQSLTQKGATLHGICLLWRSILNGLRKLKFHCQGQVEVVQRHMAALILVHGQGQQRKYRGGSLARRRDAAQELPEALALEDLHCKGLSLADYLDTLRDVPQEDKPHEGLSLSDYLPLEQDEPYQVSECSFTLVDDDVQSSHSWTMV